MSIAFHTVFILNENIKWLEEFIVYYVHLGIEKFYLYNNEGSDGCDGSKDHNKYGFPITTTSKQEDILMFENILQKYRNYIVHIKWQPLNKNNIIVYGQNESIRHCIGNYGHFHEWICFLDLDEFIFSKNGICLSEYLNQLENNISAVKIIQKKFMDRFLSKERFITQEFSCIDNLLIGTEWAPKCIVRCRDFVKVDNIHEIQTRQNTIVADVDTLRFNHYNVNEKQLAWMKHFYNSKVPFSINGVDDSMKRYRYLFDSLHETQSVV